MRKRPFQEIQPALLLRVITTCPLSKLHAFFRVEQPQHTPGVLGQDSHDIRLKKKATNALLFLNDSHLLFPKKSEIDTHACGATLLTGL